MKKIPVLLSILLLSIIISACRSNRITEKEQSETNIINAEYPVYNSAEELINSSNLVFSGTVSNITYQNLNMKSESGADSETGRTETSEIPYTIFQIKIDQVYKGNVDSDTISIKRLGGEVDGNTFLLEDAKTIETGESYLFITETYENSYPSLLNASQASYNLNTPETLNNEEEISLSEIMEYLNTLN